MTVARDFGSPDLANQTGRGGDRRSIEYHLTLDAAEAGARLENNARVREHSGVPPPPCSVIGLIDRSALAAASSVHGIQIAADD